MGRQPAGVILAAGASERLGQPKALVNLGGKPIVAWTYERLVRLGCHPVVIVTHAELAVDVMRAAPGAHVSINQNPKAGRTGSLQLGLASIQLELGTFPSRIIMAPVDRLGWSVRMMELLLEAKGSVCPRASGRMGHPVILSRSDVELVTMAKPNTPLRDILTFTGVDVEAPWLQINLDTPDDLQHILEHEEALVAHFGE